MSPEEFRLRNRPLALFYSIGCSVIFLGVFLSAIGLVAGSWLPTRWDALVGGSDLPERGWALLIDLSLVVLFGVQHSLLARPSFKTWLTRWAGSSEDRSIYGLATSLALFPFFWP